MRIVDPAISSNLSARAGRYARTLMWFTVDNGGGPFEVGFWDDVSDFSALIDGQPRVYFGSSVSSSPQLVAEVGLKVRTNRVDLNMLNAQVENLVRGYDLEGAAVELRTAYFDSHTRALLGTVVEMVGEVSGADIIEPAAGGAAICELAFASAAARLDRGVPLRKSDAALQARYPGDRFRRYNEVSGSAEVSWGELTKRQVDARKANEKARQEAARKQQAVAGDWGP